MFRVPYRWLSPYFFENVSSCYWDIRNGIRNIFRYLPIIWFDRDFDSHYLLAIMEFKFRKMAVSIGDHGNKVGCERHGKQLRICAELCKRMLAEEYIDNAGYRSETFETLTHATRIRMWEHAAMQEKQDLMYLTLMIGKHLPKWWD